MPFQIAPSPRGGTPPPKTVFPFSLEIVSVNVNGDQNQYWKKDDINCGCPCSLLSTNSQYTSSKVFLPPQNPSSSTGQAQMKKAVRVSYNSFLFKGILPPMESTSMLNSSRAYEESDPIIKIYGLNLPIILEDFFPKDDDNEVNTMKVWLTCCYSTREPEIEDSSFAAPCQSAITGDYQKEILSPWYERSTPQVAFISAGDKFPEKLVVTKIVNRSEIENRPLIDRRAVEVHVPIGEVTKGGKIRAQYLRSNLWLADVCVSGVPIKMPISAFCEGPLF